MAKRGFLIVGFALFGCGALFLSSSVTGAVVGAVGSQLSPAGVLLLLLSLPLLAMASSRTSPYTLEQILTETGISNTRRRIIRNFGHQLLIHRLGSSIDKRIHTVRVLDMKDDPEYELGKLAKVMQQYVRLRPEEQGKVNARYRVRSFIRGEKGYYLLDAPKLNAVLGFQRLGPLRYVFDKSNGTYVGIVKHTTSGKGFDWA